MLREEGTERPFSSPLNDEHRSGVFSCAGCSRELFSSRTKFDSHTGWPSFWAPLDHAVATREDGSWGMVRTEVHCGRCGGHLRRQAIATLPGAAGAEIWEPRPATVYSWKRQ